MTAFESSVLAHGDVSVASSTLPSISGWQIVVLAVLCILVAVAYGELVSRQRTRNSVGRHSLIPVERGRHRDRGE